MKKKSIIKILEELMRRRSKLPSQLAKDLGISHATVSGWLSGKYTPDTRSCLKLSEYSGIQIEEFLCAAGHMPQLNENSSFILPEFREYARTKYPEELGEDVITIIEDLIESNRKKMLKKKKARRKKAKS